MRVEGCRWLLRACAKACKGLDLVQEGRTARELCPVQAPLFIFHVATVCSSADLSLMVLPRGAGEGAGEGGEHAAAARQGAPAPDSGSLVGQAGWVASPAPTPNAPHSKGQTQCQAPPSGRRSREAEGRDSGSIGACRQRRWAVLWAALRTHTGALRAGRCESLCSTSHALSPLQQRCLAVD
jgi:hypothetical protein